MSEEQKKLLKQLRKDPKLMQMVKNLQNSQPNDDGKTLKEKLHDRIKNLSGKRTSAYSKEYLKEKNLETQKKLLQKKNEKEDNFNAQTDIENQIKRTKRNRLDRLKKLEKKYGTITDEVYSDAIIQLQREDLIEDEKHKYENFVTLYLKQQKQLSETNPVSRKTLSDSDDESCD